MKVPSQSEIKSLHEEYLRLVGGELTLTLDRMYWWGQWAARGFTDEDLRTVITHIQAQIKKGRRFEGALRWSRLIQQPDNFEEELVIARAERRNAKPAPSPKQQVLREAHTTERTTIPAPETTKHVAPIVEHWIAKMREAAQ